MAQTPPPSRSSSGAGLVIVVVAAVVALIFIYRDLVGPNLFPKRFGTVVPGEIYRSGKLTTAALTDVVREHGIRTIVDFGAWPEGSRADAREAAAAESLGVDRVVLRLVGDSTGDPNAYVAALRIMNDPSRRPVLVHCGAGTERTGCVVALYRMFEEGWTFDEALAEADGAGHDPERNPRLRETLETWGDPIRDSLVTGRPIEVETPLAAEPGPGG